MFNYECKRRNGTLVGACMDGFLFGACCQLSTKEWDNRPLEPMDDDLFNPHEIDHVPDEPILLNQDGYPFGASTSSKSTAKPHLSTFGYGVKDVYQNAEKPQIISSNYPTDDLKLPNFITHYDPENGLQEKNNQNDKYGSKPASNIQKPDQVFQNPDRIDHSPGPFTHKLTDRPSAAETILLNKNGTVLHENYDPDELFKPTKFIPTTISARHPLIQKTKTSASATKTTESKISSTQKVEGTTPMTLSTHFGEELLRVPTIINGPHKTGNKKTEQHGLDKEEIAINHIISLLNDTGSEPKVTTQGEL